MPATRIPAAAAALLLVLVAFCRADETKGQPPAAIRTPSGGNLVANPDCETASAKRSQAARYQVQGDAIWTLVSWPDETASRGFALRSGQDLNGDRRQHAEVSQDVSEFPRGRGQWFRFSIRGLAQDQFAVADGDLLLKVEYFGDKGRSRLDGVVKKLFPQIERDRRDLAVNGNGRKGGAAVWKTYALEFMLPFNEIDLLRLSVGFRQGAARSAQDAFLVDDFELVPLASASAGASDGDAPPPAVDPDSLASLGGRWYRSLSEAGRASGTKGVRGLQFSSQNADQLWYDDGVRLTNPFVQNMSVLLRAGYKDRQGRVVAADRWLSDNVRIAFERDVVALRVKNLPNHPTARFPDLTGLNGYNPSYIQEQDDTYYLPLAPRRNPRAVAMNANNSNRALPMGPIGVAINGVVFYNPFDVGNQDASDIMDRCCGHPSPDNRYHYHKYPVCIKSPFVDEGKEHSPVIGWAFDGFPIYGPYERDGVMAKDCRDNPLNDFNVHRDDVRGWHYHVTPGRFPYVIGGYWGEVDGRNLRRPRPRQAGRAVPLSVRPRP